MVYNFDQIVSIIKNNPSKGLVQKGQEMARKLLLHIHGKGMKEAIERCDYFENQELYAVRKRYAVSNKDLYGRLLHQEDMVFTAKGGSTSFNLSEEQEKALNAVLEDVRYGLSLRKWIQNFALQAYRCDPMGILFIEVEKTNPNAEQPATPKAYPTYKSIFSIYNYDMTGRRLEHVCFRLTVAEALSFGVKDDGLKEYKPDHKSDYYRFIDDEKDIIVKYEGAEVTKTGNDLPNIWGRTPGIIASNLIQFDDPSCFLSPLYLTVELADCFLYDRSVRDLQKRYHGFSKAIEPLLMCPTCQGTGLIAGKACPDCSAPGGTQGTGYKLQTKVSDVARFPLELAEHSFDWRRFFGYATPDVAGWEKQDTSLTNLETMIEQTYWGTSQPKQVTGVQNGDKLEETATKTMANLQPRYARLNMTAEWAEKTEGMLADFLGQFWFPDTFKASTIAYGRYYILETPDELWEQYQAMRSKGAPESALYEALEKYYHSVYQNSPMELAVRLKLLYVEPFPHLNVSQLKGIVTDQLDFNCKLYFGEWYSQLSDIEVISTKTEVLRQKLRDYVKKKNIPEPEPVDPKLQ